MIAEQMGIFGLSIHEKIAEGIVTSLETPGIDKAGWVNKSEFILPVYQEAILNEGMPFFVANDPGTFETYRYVADRTGFVPGYVYIYLETLESLARTGQIDFKHWRPEERKVKAVTTRILPEDIQAPKAVASLLALDIPAAMQSAWWKIALLGGLVLTGYVLVRTLK